MLCKLKKAASGNGGSFSSAVTTLDGLDQGSEQ